MGDIDYLESVIKKLIEALKQKNCLDQDFQFLVKAERQRAFERCVDEFLNQN